VQVSVVIPVRDGERYLGEAVESVLGQRHAPSEVLVVDDGSRDRTADVAAVFPGVEVVKQEPRGVGAALNCGVSRARCELLAFLDADDVWLPEKLERQIAVLRQRPDVEAVFGHVEQFVDGCAPRAAEPGYAPGTMLIRRGSLERIGPFATGWRVGDFIDWWARALDRGLQTVLLADVVLRRRVHGANVGIRLSAERGEYARVLKAVLDRRRSER
jgi:glycosyltransferase involved in cell wall biosynthesis